MCTYDGDSLVIWREWKSHRLPIQRVQVVAACEIYFLGPDLVIVTETGSLVSLKAHAYRVYKNPLIVSSTDRITSLALYQNYALAIG